MTTPFIEGRCYFTPESIVEISADWGGDDLMVGYNLLHGIDTLPIGTPTAYAWVPRYVVAALIFGEE